MQSTAEQMMTAAVAAIRQQVIAEMQRRPPKPAPLRHCESEDREGERAGEGCLPEIVPRLPEKYVRN